MFFCKKLADMKKISTEDNIIQFIYKIADLFNNVSLKSSYKARLVSDDGRVVDDLTMLDDDKSAFMANIQKLLTDIYERVIKLTSSVENAYELTEDHIIIKIQNNESFNSNVLDIVDASIYECIETGSMKEWYSICGKTDYEQEYTAKYMSALNLLSNRMFQLKKKSIRSTLGTLE